MTRSYNHTIYMLLLLTLLISVARACAPGQCTSIDGGCQLSQPGTSCGECGWVGWLRANSSCAANPDPVDALVSCDASTLSCVGSDGSCVTADVGVRCAECQYRGYLQGNPPTCVCYDPLWVPQRRCGTALSPSHALEVVEATLDSVWCEPFQSKQLGCFAAGDETIYGMGDPFTPTECCSGIYGPPIGQLVEEGGGGIGGRNVTPTGRSIQMNRLGRALGERVQVTASGIRTPMRASATPNGTRSR